MKDLLCVISGLVGGWVASVFGGWDSALTTMVIFMGVDYLTGMLVAGVFHNSPKTEGGTLESRTGWKGLVRKGVVLLVLLVACRLDILVGSQSFFRDATVIAFVVNEALSILENVGLIGVKVPPVLQRAIEVLRKRSEGEAPSQPPAAAAPPEGEPSPRTTHLPLPLGEVAPPPGGDGEGREADGDE